MKTEERKKEISKAVLKILETDGIQGLKTGRIAREVGFSEAALYRHFKNKAAILEFILDQRLDVTLKNKAQVDAMQLDPPESIRALFRKQMAFMEKSPGLYRLIYSDELHIGSESLINKLREISNIHYQTILSYVQRAMDEGHMDKTLNPRNIAMALMGCVHSAFSARVVLGKKIDIGKLGMDMIDLFLNGVLNGGPHGI